MMFSVAPKKKFVKLLVLQELDMRNTVLQEKKGGRGVV